MNPFHPYGMQHASVVVASVVGWWAIVRLARRSRNRPGETRLRWGLAGAILLLEGSWFCWKLTPDQWNIDSSLPFHLCDFAWMACVWSLIAAGSPHRLIHQTVVLWTLGLSVLGYLTPTVDVPPDDARFWEFWLIHWMVLATGILNIAAFGTAMTWRGCRGTIAISLALFFPVTLFNLAFDTPYFFSGKGTPDNPTPIDLLGEWPLRLLWMILLVIAWFHLLTRVLRSRWIRGGAG